MLFGQVVAADRIHHDAAGGQIVEQPVRDHAGFGIRQGLVVAGRDFGGCADVVEHTYIVQLAGEHIDCPPAAQLGVLVLAEHQLPAAGDGLAGLIAAEGFDLLAVDIEHDCARRRVPADRDVMHFAVEQLRIGAGRTLDRRTVRMGAEPDAAVAFQEQRQLLIECAVGIGEQRRQVGAGRGHRERGFDRYRGQTAEQTCAVIGDKVDIVAAVLVDADRALGCSRHLQIDRCIIFGCHGNRHRRHVGVAGTIVRHVGKRVGTVEIGRGCVVERTIVVQRECSRIRRTGDQHGSQRIPFLVIVIDQHTFGRADVQHAVFRHRVVLQAAGVQVLNLVRSQCGTKQRDLVHRATEVILQRRHRAGAADLRAGTDRDGFEITGAAGGRTQTAGIGIAVLQLAIDVKLHAAGAEGECDVVPLIVGQGRGRVDEVIARCTLQARLDVAGAVKINTQMAAGTVVERIF